METMREMSAGAPLQSSKLKGKPRDKIVSRPIDTDAPKQPVEIVVGTALKRGGRGRPVQVSLAGATPANVQLYGNSVIFKDRNLLEPHEYLDLAAGPPIASHRSSPRSKKTQLLDSIELEDKSKLSGQHPKIPRLDFAASARATGLTGKELKGKRTKPSSPASPKLLADPLPPPSLSAMIAALSSEASLANGGTKSPALTGKRVEAKAEMFSASDVSKLSVDDLLVALEQQDIKKASITHSNLEEEEQYVRRSISLRKELQNLVSSGKLVPAQTLHVPPGSSRQLIVLMTPNGSTRPHISNRAKRADSRIFIKLVEFDRSLLSHVSVSTSEVPDLPVRDLIIRSTCVRSVLEVQQSSINFGACEKGEAKSKTIVLHNKSDCIGMFRLRTSGSIASGDLKLGLGRYGVISAFGRKEVEHFSFVPSLVGNYQENIVVENLLDSYNDQIVAVKANVRKQPTFIVEPTKLDFGAVDATSKWPGAVSFVLTNVSKVERTFSVEVAPSDYSAFAEISVTRDIIEAGNALSRAEEEELEGLLQKLKIARRKGKTDKISKYESRLAELGAPQTSASESDVDSTEDGPSELGTPLTEDAPPLKTCVMSISVTLQPNMKNKILVELLPLPGHLEPLNATIKVYDRKNTDETLGITIIASPSASNHTASALASSSASSASTGALSPVLGFSCS